MEFYRIKETKNKICRDRKKKNLLTPIHSYDNQSVNQFILKATKYINFPNESNLNEQCLKKWICIHWLTNFWQHSFYLPQSRNKADIPKNFCLNENNNSWMKQTYLENYHLPPVLLSNKMSLVSFCISHNNLIFHFYSWWSIFWFFCMMLIS
jgi:hypothetical protein